MHEVCNNSAERAKQTLLTEDALYRTIKGTLAYALFVAVFSVVAYSSRSETDYWANRAMKQLFVESPFFFGHVTHEKVLADVHFTPQFFQWLEGPFLERLHSSESACG